MATIELSEKELSALIMALETAVDIAGDTVIEPLFTDDNVVSFSTLAIMREQVEAKVDELVCLVRLLERAKSLK
jgi:hypothetical protein